MSFERLAAHRDAFEALIKQSGEYAPMLEKIKVHTKCKFIMPIGLRDEQMSIRIVKNFQMIILLIMIVHVLTWRT